MARWSNVLVALVVLSVARPMAQTAGIGMAFESGRVTIVATDVLVSDVLREWSRAGGTVVKGIETLPPSRVTLRLVDAGEVDALQAILGASGGYIFTRHAETAAGRSQLKSLTVAPSSGAPAAVVQTVSAPQVNRDIPEARFVYVTPAEEHTEDLLRERADAAANPPPPVSPEEAKIIPERRFNYFEPGPQEPPAEEAPADPKPDPKTKKPPSGI